MKMKETFSPQFSAKFINNFEIQTVKSKAMNFRKNILDSRGNLQKTKLLNQKLTKCLRLITEKNK